MAHFQEYALAIGQRGQDGVGLLAALARYEGFFGRGRAAHLVAELDMSPGVHAPEGVDGEAPCDGERQGIDAVHLVEAVAQAP